MEKLNDVIDPSICFSISEAKSEVDGHSILGVIEGEFFVPDGKSRNGRVYPRSLWEKIINDPNIRTKLQNRLMLGSIGHDVKITEEAVREGLISHIMKDIVIDEKGKGKGTALILNTPAGKILNTLLRAKVKLPVSSRATGTFKGKTPQGLPIVDEDTYNLLGWDFVLEPGFLEAVPEIKESLQEFENQFNILEYKEGDRTMEKESIDKTLIQHIANENHELKTKVSDLTDTISGLEESNKVLQEENSSFNEEVSNLESALKTIAQYEELADSPEQMEEALNLALELKSKVAEYEELADSPEQMEEALSKSLEISEEVSSLGGITQVKEALETLESFEELGSFEDVSEALNRINEMLESEEQAKKEEEISSLAEEFNLSSEKVSSLLEKLSIEEVRSIYEEVKKPNSFKKKGTTLSSDFEKEDRINESKPSLAEKIGGMLC